jgi:AraC-like DNA-binding protein
MMLQKVFDSRDVPVSDRLDAWHDLTTRVAGSNQISVDDPVNFRATLSGADMGIVRTSVATYSSLRTRRTPKLIREYPVESYSVGLVLRGRQVVVQERVEAAPRLGELLLWTDLRPYEALVEARKGMASTVVVVIPRQALPIPATRLDRLLASPLTGQDGIGGLLGGFLTRLAADTHPARHADLRRLGGVLLDLTIAWLAGHLDAEPQVPVDTRQHVRFLQVRAFICQNLHDPRLTPGDIAAAHHMSLRSLYRLFDGHGYGVASYIRHERLTRAARDLADPDLASRPVHAIASALGYTRSADFSRAFRVAFGVTPSEYRHVAVDRDTDGRCRRDSVGPPASLP